MLSVLLVEDNRVFREAFKENVETAFPDHAYQGGGKQ